MPNITIISLPTETVLHILGYLKTESLRNISVTCQRLNQLSNVYLWRHISLDDDLPGAPPLRRRRKAVSAKCDAITRDVHRAQCIESVDICVRWSFSNSERHYKDGPWLSLSSPRATRRFMKRILDALTFLSSLKRLELVISGPKEHRLFSQMLSSYSLRGRLPFRLVEFQINEVPQLSLHAFLETQDEIRYFAITSSRSLDMAGTLDTSLLLPQLHRCKIPALIAKQFIKGRHLQFLELRGWFSTSELRQARYADDHLLTWQASDDKTSSVTAPVAAIVHEISMPWFLWPESDIEELLPAIRVLCGISLSGITALDILSNCWPYASFPEAAISGLPALEKLGWWWDRGDVPYHDMSDQQMLGFAKSAARNSSTLLKLCIKHDRYPDILFLGMENIIWCRTFTRLCSDMGEHHSMQEGTESTWTTVFTDDHGSIWLLDCLPLEDFNEPYDYRGANRPCTYCAV